NCQIRSATKHFTQRRIVWINLRASVKRIAFQRVVVRPKVAAKHTVLLIEVVVDADVDCWATDCRRRVPEECSRIQSATGSEVVGKGEQLEEVCDCWIEWFR